MVQDTSIEAYRHLNVGLLQARVLYALDTMPEIPTTYEVAKWMFKRGLARDLNSVRPRFTELQKLGIVGKITKRKCGVTGNTAYTWGRLR